MRDCDILINDEPILLAFVEIENELAIAPHAGTVWELPSPRFGVDL